ncbi:MAG: hypothetical protein RL291_1062, partial [Pseudomonadota bacterium]
ILGAATLTLRVEDGRMLLRSFDAKAPHGRWNATMKLERAPIGAALSGVVRLADGKFERFALAAPASAPPGQMVGAVDGNFSGLLTFNGRGANLRAIVDALEGGGSIDTGELRISGVVPGGIEPAAEALVRSREPVSPDAVRKAIDDAIESGTLVARPARYTVTLADGALRIAPTTFELEDGRSTADAVIDLSTLSFASTWKLEARRVVARATAAQAWSTETRRQAWPVVNLLVSGPLGAARQGQAAAFSRQLLLDEFLREFTVRKVEYDVAELERLRKLDEDRAREEVERRRRLEQQQAPAPAAPPAASAPQPGAEPQPPAAPPAAASPQPMTVPGLAPAPEAAPQGARTIIEGFVPQPVAAPPPPQIAPPSAAATSPAPKENAPSGYRPATDGDVRRLFDGSGR